MLLAWKKSTLLVTIQNHYMVQLIFFVGLYFRHYTSALHLTPRHVLESILIIFYKLLNFACRLDYSIFFKFRSEITFIMNFSCTNRSACVNFETSCYKINEILKKLREELILTFWCLFIKIASFRVINKWG